VQDHPSQRRACGSHRSPLPRTRKAGRRRSQRARATRLRTLHGARRGHSDGILRRKEDRYTSEGGRRGAPRGALARYGHELPARTDFTAAAASTVRFVAARGSGWDILTGRRELGYDKGCLSLLFLFSANAQTYRAPRALALNLHPTQRFSLRRWLSCLRWPRDIPRENRPSRIVASGPWTPVVTSPCPSSRVSGRQCAAGRSASALRLTAGAIQEPLPPTSTRAPLAWPSPTAAPQSLSHRRALPTAASLHLTPAGRPPPQTAAA
jgi:hypothetical protein